MYKVIVDKVEEQGTSFEGRGSTIQAALNRAKAEMEESYGRGVAGFTYSTYKQNDNTESGWQYLQTFGV